MNNTKSKYNKITSINEAFVKHANKENNNISNIIILVKKNWSYYSNLCPKIYNYN